MQLYERYIAEHLSVLEEIHELMKVPKFEALYRDFESQKICYLPLTTFILKPLQRLLHYLQILESKFIKMLIINSFRTIVDEFVRASIF